MKLELKHLAPYLPYKLKCLAQGEDKKVFDIQGITDFTDVDLHEKGRTVNEQYDIEDVFPILRPLSDLTRKELELEGFDSHIDYLTYENKGVDWTLKAPYVMVEYLFSKYFDVFGLIEKGLAIDINALKL